MHVPRVFAPLLLRPPTVVRLSSISTRKISYTMQKMSENTADTSPSPPSPPKRHPVVKYDLYRGHPNMNLLPQSEMKAIMSDILQDDDASWRNDLNYGANAGSGKFRSVLRSFLDRRTMDDDMGEETISADADIMQQHDKVEQEHSQHELFITGGVSHGLELLCATHTQPGDEVWVERPTYFLAPGIFKSHNLVVKPLPMISDTTTASSSSEQTATTNDCNIGRVDIDRLIHQVENEGITAPKMMYIIPSSHNPTGRSMTVQERGKMASFAIRNNILLVADEVYHLLDWKQKDSIDGTEATSKRPAGMVHFDNTLSHTDDSKQSKDTTKGCCISVSSFTKIWAPGIRLGWIDAPSHIIQPLKDYGYIDSQGGVAPFMGRIMTHAIESNLLDSYLDKLRVEYGERYRLVCDLLKTESRITILSEKSPVKRIGGYFNWIQFPSGVNSDNFFAFSMEKFSVRFMSGGKCDPFPQEGSGVDDTTGASIRSCARLCFADLEREKLIDATKVFLQAFRSYMDTVQRQTS